MMMWQRPADMLSVLELLGAALGCVLVLSRVRTWMHDKTRRLAFPLPPGPSTLWFSPGGRLPFKFAQLTEMYGPVFSFKQGTRVVCVVGRHQAAVEIMQKHGADLADRPRSIAAGELLSGGKRTLLVGAGDRLRKLRKALHSHLQPSVAVQYRPMQLKHALNVILDILRDPEHHIDHARRYAASVVMTMTYGKTEPTYYTDPEVQEILLHGTRLGSVIPLDYHQVDRFPILKHVPFVTSTLRQWHKEELALFSNLVDGARARLRDGAPPSFATYLIDQQQQFGLSDDEIAYLAGSMFGAGSDTSATAIAFVIMAAATHPKAQAEVQAQLDSVVGRDRVPSFDDESLLPLVTAFYLEAYRWRPVSYGGFAHKATADIRWGEYVIPADAIVIGNHWSIAHDPDVFPEPEEFRPSRWLDESGKLREDLSSFNFGFGRRVCVGQHVANNSLFINTALILWAFSVGEDPAQPIDTMAFTDTANVRVHPFKAVYEPRIPRLREVVETYLD